MDIENKKNIILIDLSYFIFYRYYALVQWWKLAKPDNELGNPIENLEFVEKFKKTFYEKMREIAKKLKLKDTLLIGARDCPRSEIWRHEIYNKYKEHRGQDDDFMGGPFFKLAYNELIPNICEKILKCDNLEADDCVALTSKYIRSKYPDKSIYIIANDMDYLQLADENIQIINLKYKNLQTSKHCSGNNKRDLFNKIILGDKSDNIPPVFKKCGPKTVSKYFENPELFKTILEKENAYENYEINKKIIDFNEIPENLILKFYKLNNLDHKLA